MNHPAAGALLPALAALVALLSATPGDALLALTRAAATGVNETGRPRRGFPWNRQPAKDELNHYDHALMKCKARGSQPLQNGVITYLVTRPKDVQNFVDHAAPRLWHFFLKHRPYPVIVFVPSARLRAYDRESFADSPDARTLMNLLRTDAGLPEECNIKVEEFDLKFPRVIARDPEWRAKRNGCAQLETISYNHMNQFFTKIMYEHRALKPYKYYARLDADLMFRTEMPTDPFCLANELGRTFMWQRRKQIQGGACSWGMWEWFKKYAEDHGLEAQDVDFWNGQGGHTNYVGFIGVGDLDFFRSREVRRLATAFNRDGRVYLYRWSDQTYYVLLLALMKNRSAVGDIGINWPEATWCHRCKQMTPFKDTVPSLMSGSSLMMGGPPLHLGDPPNEPIDETQ